MSSPFSPLDQYSDTIQPGLPSAPIVIAARNPSNSVDKNYSSGVLWLSDISQGGSGNLYVQEGTSAGVPTWTALSAGSAGGINTISDGTTQVSPIGGNLALVSTPNQVTVTSSAPSHELIFSIPAVFIAPGSIASTTTLTVGTNLIVNGTSTFTGGITFSGNVSITPGTLTVAGLTTLGALTQVGTLSLNASGSATTTIGGSSGAMTITVGTGNFALVGAGNTVGIANDGAANLVTLGSATGVAATHIQAGTGDLLLDGATTAQIILGSITQTGLIIVGRSTAGENISIGDGINASAQTISIGNGASAANSTVNILSGIGTVGAGVLALGNNTRVTTIGLGNIAPAAARVITIAGGNQAQNDTVTILGGAASAGTQTFNLFSGNSAGATQNINLATGTGAVGVNIGTGATGVKTIAIGGTAANVITIANTQTAGSLAFGALMTTGTITMGGAVMTGLITIGAATNATGQTVNISSAASIAGPNIVNVLAGATPAASQTFNLMTGVGTAGTYAVNILTGASTGTTQTFSVANAATNAATVIAIGNDVGVSGTTLKVGTGNFLLAGAVTSTYTIGTALGTGLINIGLSTAGQTVALNNAASNTVANVVNILNGATPGANNTLNIMNGAGTAGTQTVNILASGATRAGAINLGTGIAAHVVTIGQVTSSLVVNAPQTNTLASGAAVGITVNTSAGTGRGISVTSSGVAVPDYASLAGGILVTPTDTAAGASPRTASNRHFKVEFSGVSIAANADQTLTITNTVITGASTDIMISWRGTTTGSAVSLKSVVPGAGTVALTFTNGVGATTTTANIEVVGWVLN